MLVLEASSFSPLLKSIPRSTRLPVVSQETQLPYLEEDELPPFPAAEIGKPPVRDGPYGLFMIAAFRLAMGKAASWQSGARYLGESIPGESYAGLVDIARKLFAGSAEATSARVTSVLRAFPTNPQFLGYNKLSCELLGALTPMFMGFLVGPSKVEAWNRTVETVPGARFQEGEVWRSKVAIERCRFLEGAQCKGMCVSLCQAPTQTFFTEELGLPLRMTPNFETGACEMVWGLHPEPPIDLGAARASKAPAAAAVGAGIGSVDRGGSGGGLKTMVAEGGVVSGAAVGSVALLATIQGQDLRCYAECALRRAPGSSASRRDRPGQAQRHGPSPCSLLEPGAKPE
eukprot:CAMPEP_0172594644 /NCGR_PEP_ID=MMETSP1068-20121228/14102_1 /TAXON_ID=35684 /ORGANISM="Pseudopedinella elastica, Strain CCMP716" /LENGTH=343 /DNA_ID=CAMNT_0013392795 /DNA_START=24 /DNA_END=1055 /DNA_ORIENTATION=+